MLQVLSGVVARWPIGGALVGGVDSLTRGVANWIEVTRSLECERSSHWLWLAGLIVCAAFLRFWGLGLVGFHGDEETMAMAASSMLVDGTPTLPSGMFYPRGLAQQYLMVASAALFGVSEWSMRLPSAVFGVLLIPFVFLIGRRFLNPRWNIAFVASVVLLPELIVYSQTARMYVFLLVAIAVCIASVFEWERTDRAGWLIVGIIALIAGIELHALAAFSALIFLMPGLVRGDLRKLFYGVAASACVLGGYFIIDSWVNSQYPVPPSDYASDLPPSNARDTPTRAFEPAQLVSLLSVALVGCFAAMRMGRSIRERPWSIVFSVLAAVTLTLQLARFYHLAAFTMTAACVLALRLSGPRPTRPLLAFVACSGALLLAQVAFIYAGGLHSPTKVVGALIGQPSVWAYVRVGGYSTIAALLCAGTLVLALARIVRQQRIPDYVVFAILTIGIPLFVMGLFLWDLPVRYTAGSAIPLLLCGFAFAQWAVGALGRRSGGNSSTTVQTLVAAFLVVLIVNPLTFAAVVHSGYRTHPDHKGAAEFMHSQNIQPDDIVIAEDVLQQTYYLGSVDYWLVSKEVARRFVQRVDGRIQDFYTGSGVLGTGAELQAVLDANPGRRIYVIGSGENQEDGRSFMRAHGIGDVLESGRFEVLYVGRDRLTKVWRARPPDSSPMDRSPSAAGAGARELPSAAMGRSPSAAVTAVMERPSAGAQERPAVSSQAQPSPGVPNLAAKRAARP